MGVDQVQSGRLVLCPASHKNARGITDCAVCGLPMVDFAEEIDSTLSMFNDVKKIFVKSKRVTCLGLGETGSRLLFTLLSSTDKNISSPHFLVVNPNQSDVKTFKEWLSNNQGTVNIEKFLKTSTHKLRSSKDSSGWVWGQAKNMGVRDGDMHDKLRRIGVSESVEDQLFVIMASLGDGESSGIGPDLLEEVKEINPDATTVVFAILPSNTDTDQMHFNAYCGLSRYLRMRSKEDRRRDSKLADLIIVLQGEAIDEMMGIDKSGKKVLSNFLIPRMVKLIFGDDNGMLGEMTSIARSFRIQAFSPVYAYGRSYAIYDNVGNIMDYATYFPLSPFAFNSVVLSMAIARVPKTVLSNVGTKRIEEQFNSWSKKRFRAVKRNYLKIFEVDDVSDRLDILLLLGGTSMKSITSSLHDGYLRFKSDVSNMTLWDEYGLNNRDLEKIESTMNSYDKGMAHLVRQAARA